MRVSIAGEVVGISIPISFSSERMPTARPTPVSSPRAPATSPIDEASRRTPLRTCRRVAPTARRSATSRRRCATSTLKVFQMTKVPTRRATPAKTSSTVVKMPIASRTAAVPSAATCSPVTASAPSGSTAEIRPCRTSASTPSAASTSTSSTSPSLPSTLLGRGQVEPGHGRAEDAVGLPETDDADQREGPASLLEHDVDAGRPPGTRPCRPSVASTTTSSGPDGRTTLPDPARAGQPAVGVDVGAERRRTARLDRVAVRVDDQREPGHRPLGRPRPRGPLALSRRRSRPGDGAGRRWW